MPTIRGSVALLTMVASLPAAAQPAYPFEVKKPGEAGAPGDHCTLRATIPADAAFMPLSASTCPLVGK